jgi:pilus assembly protein CpaB
MRRGGMILVVVLAVAFALLASGLTYMYINHQVKSKGVYALQPVVVAAQDLTFGTTLKPEQLKVAMFPKESIPLGSYAVPESLVGQNTKVFMLTNEPVLESKLSTKGGGLSLTIPMNMRASSIKVDKVTGVSGFVLPGDKVDVIMIVDRPSSGTRDPIARTILQNISVLAAGEKTEQEGNKPITVQAVTLLVDPPGAEAVALATNQGKIQLALRNPTDSTTVKIPSIQQSNLVGGTERKEAAAPKAAKKKEPEKPKEEVKKPIPPDTVNIIKGGKIGRQQLPTAPETTKTETKK